MKQSSKKLFKHILIGCFLFFLVNIGFAYAENLSDWRINTTLGAQSKYDVSKSSATDLATYIGSLLKWVPMLGVTFIIQIVLAGYEWMSASGDSKKVDESKKRIQHAVIGLVMFIGVYAISYFIYDKLTYVADYQEKK